MDEFDGTDIDAACRLADDQEIGILFDLARQHDLLLVAAGKQPKAQIRILRTNIEIPHFLLSVGSDGAAVLENALLIELIAVIAKDHILAGVEGSDDAEPVPVLGHMGELLGAGFRRIAGERLAIEQDFTRKRRPDPGDRFQ